MHARKLFLALVVAALTFGVMLPAAAAPTSESMEGAGWTCFPAGPVANIHCAPPSVEGLAAPGAATAALVFSPDGATFLGVESLRFTSRDLSGLPCPKETGGHWHSIGPDTWACHHWKGAPAT